MSAYFSVDTALQHLLASSYRLCRNGCDLGLVTLYQVILELDAIVMFRSKWFMQALQVQ